MSDAGKRYWFPAKKFGWGWGLPRTWEGALTLLAYVVALFALRCLVSPIQHAMLFATGAILLTGALLTVCWCKGEPPGGG